MGFYSSCCEHKIPPWLEKPFCEQGLAGCELSPRQGCAPKSAPLHRGSLGGAGLGGQVLLSCYTLAEGDEEHV